MVAFDVLAAVQGGGYISILKIIPVLLVLALWARLLGWADVDALAAHLPRIPLNLANLGGMILAFALFFLVPTFVIAFSILMVAFLAEVGVYLQIRHKEVGLKDLEKQFKEWRAGTKNEKTDEIEVAPNRVTLIGKDGKPLPVPDSDSPDRASYDVIQQALVDPILKGAQQIDLAPEGDAMSIKYTVDNFTHNGPTVDKASGTAAIAYMKWAGGLNIEDRRKPQTATVKSLMVREKHELRIQTAGTTAGEYLRITVDPKGRHIMKVVDLGFTDAQKKLITDLIKDKSGGLVLLTAPKGHGLSTLFYSIMRSHDAFIEHVLTVERDQQEDMEGITQHKLAPTANSAEEADKVDWAISQQPDALGVDKVENPKSAALLIELAKTKRVYIGMKANSTFEALESWKKLVGNSRLATENLKLIINGRVMRKLCTACKEGFTPDPATLKKLNLSTDAATTLYKAREQSIRDSKGVAIPCEFCRDLRFQGRTGVFETLLIDDEVRQTVDAGKPLSQAFRKQKGRYLQEEALVQVERGETSVQEVLRVLKPAPEGDRAAAAPPAAAPVSRAAPGAKTTTLKRST